MMSLLLWIQISATNKTLRVAESLLVLQSPSNRLEHLRQHFPACVLALEKIKPGEMVQIGSTS
jgi:hypothetical protein